jgi:hypothetical protein
MPDLVKVRYAHNGKSTKTDEFGMREMQARAYESRDAQYLLLKAPAAFGSQFRGACAGSWTATSRCAANWEKDRSL